MTEQTIFERLESAKTAEEFDAKASEIESEALARAEYDANTRPNLRGRLNNAVRTRMNSLVSERLSFIVYEKRVRMGFTKILTDPEEIKARDDRNDIRRNEAHKELESYFPLGMPERYKLKAHIALDRKLDQGIKKKRAIDAKILKEWAEKGNPL